MCKQLFLLPSEMVNKHETIIMVERLFNVVPIICGGLVFGPCF